MLQVAHLEKLFPGKDVGAPVRTTESVWNPSDKSVIMVRLYKSLPAWLDMESALGLGWTGWVPKSSGASFSLITAANCQHYPALPFSFAPHRQCHFQKCLLDRLQFVTMADERPFADSFQLLLCCCCHSWLLLAWVCVAFVHPFIPLTKPHSWGLWLDTTGGSMDGPAWLWHSCCLQEASSPCGPGTPLPLPAWLAFLRSGLALCTWGPKEEMCCEQSWGR